MYPSADFCSVPNVMRALLSLSLELYTRYAYHLSAGNLKLKFNTISKFLWSQQNWGDWLKHFLHVNPSKHILWSQKLCYTAKKNAQPVTMLMKTSLNIILLPIFFLIVNNIVQHCSAWFIAWTILLTIRNNMGNKILFKLVFINIVTGWA